MGETALFRRARVLWGRFEEAAELDPLASTRAFLRVYRAYGAPERAYHGRCHVVDVVTRAARLGRCLAAESVTALLAAAWYHDVVYDSRRCDNEGRSARVM